MPPQRIHRKNGHRFILSDIGALPIIGSGLPSVEAIVESRQVEEKRIEKQEKKEEKTAVALKQAERESIFDQMELINQAIQKLRLEREQRK